ncbi:MAG: RedB protein [Planctomycetes bacterium]|nr:RedB protein [Planctomycetota bacterium]
MPIKSLSAWPLVTALWVCGVVLGTAQLIDFSSAPGRKQSTPQSWPVTTEITRSTSRATLVMFVHPRCACSLASLHELARLAAVSHDRIDFKVLFVEPPGAGPDWHRSALWDQAQTIPRLSVGTDRGGVLATRFGVTTSGHCFVYDVAGDLVFSGGITAGRGHEGDSPGQSMIRSLTGQPATDRLNECATFGCPLFADQSQSETPTLKTAQAR